MKKKLAALALSLVMVVSLTGCMGNFISSVVTVEGEAISPGLYLMMQLRAYSEAEGLVEDEEKDVLKQKVEGQGAAAWIQDTTVESLKRYVAVQRLAEEYGVKISEESWEYIESNVQYWEYTADYYERNGVGYESFLYQMEISYLDDDLFYALYGEGGERAPDIDETKAAYEGMAAHIRYFSIPTTTLASDDEESVDMLDTVMGLVGNMQTEIKAGASFEEAAAGLEGIYATLGREFDPEAAEDYIYTSYIAYDSEYYDEDYLTELENAAVGDTGIYNNDGYLMLYQKLETFESDEDWEERQSYVLESLYRDEYEEWLKGIYSGYSVSKNAFAQWYYRPSKID